MLLTALGTAGTLRLGFVLFLLNLYGTIGNQMILALAVVTPLWLWSNAAFGSDVVGKFTTVVATYFSEAFLGERTAVGALAVNGRGARDTCCLQTLIRFLALKLYVLLVAE